MGHLVLLLRAGDGDERCAGCTVGIKTESGKQTIPGDYLRRGDES